MLRLLKYLEILNCFINHLNGDYKYLSNSLKVYYDTTLDLLSKFDSINLFDISSYFNEEANDMAQKASLDSELLRKILI